ncbi:Flp family type IVb pilin [Pelagibacterium lacus]|uniref:Flp family type IVb pilin n=1 Tax=Pelagibacterium lacus TaxID=2282655 RepID=A0A369W6Q4_9HYPH|nr:Flp family type IVb pilin [Pelagibacterium lacus]RDE10013.1 Flp family type IVb pilin [Pelagibacterium lacus]
MNLFKKFAADESGATAIEYGLIAALMAVVVIAAINILGPEIEKSFGSIGEQLTNPKEQYTGGTGDGV